MKPAKYLRHVVTGINAYRTRTALSFSTSLVASIVLAGVLSLTNGFADQLNDILNRWGQRVCLLVSRNPSGKPQYVRGFSTEEFDYLRSRFTREAVFSATKQGEAQIEGTRQRGDGFVISADPHYAEVKECYVTQGSPLDEEDEEEMAKVCIIGPSASVKLFGKENAVGSQLTVDGIPFLVKGIRCEQPDGYGVTIGQSQHVWIPLSTGMKRVFAATAPTRIGAIAFRVREGYDVQKLIEEMTTLLRTRHGLKSYEQNNFMIFSASHWKKNYMDGVQTTITLGFVLAGVALALSGSISVMSQLNVLRQRSREFGLKMAIGARPLNIFFECIIEVALINLSGIALGILITMVIGRMIPEMFIIPDSNGASQYPMKFSFIIALQSLGILTLTSALFTLYPAWAASKENPVEALR